MLADISKEHVPSIFKDRRYYYFVDGDSAFLLNVSIHLKETTRLHMPENNTLISALAILVVINIAETSESRVLIY
jgi:hypothetical protein